MVGIDNKMLTLSHQLLMNFQAQSLLMFEFRRLLIHVVVFTLQLQALPVLRLSKAYIEKSHSGIATFCWMQILQDFNEDGDVGCIGEEVEYPFNDYFLASLERFMSTIEGDIFKTEVQVDTGRRVANMNQYGAE